MKMLERWGPLFSRVLIAVIFVVLGFSKLGNPSAVAAEIAAKGLPMATLIAIVAGLIECAAGLSILMGLFARYSALALSVYLVPVTLVFHNPAGLDAVQALMQAHEILKNLAIIGGLVAIAAFGSGPLSVDSRRRKRTL